jgi:NhaA family Na+:H+ antiporter
MKAGAAAGRAHHRHASRARPATSGRFPRLADFAFEHLLVLPAGAVLALIWANAGPESYYSFAYAARFFVNDIAMVFFFAVVTKEIVEATAPGGVLHPWRKALVPVIAAAGATIPAVLLFAAGARALDAPMLARGWPVAFAVDLAAVFFIARMIFGRHPVVPFLLLLGIAANGAGFVVLAIQAPVRTGQAEGAVALMTAAVVAAAWLRKARVTTFWPYVIVGGTLSWLALLRAGLHPAFALVPILPFLPHAARDPGFFVDARSDARDALNQFEVWCRHPAQLALFLFGLLNAGVPLRWVESSVLALPLAAAARPVGLLVAVGLAVAAGLPLPHRVGWRELLVVGVISGTGFTMALFFATTSLAPGQLLNEMKVAALLSLAAGALAFPLARLLRVGRVAR